MLDKPALLWRIILTLLVFVFLTVPGSRSTWFNGLPLSPYEAVISFIILVIIWSTSQFAYRHTRLLWSVTLSLMIIWQLIGAAFVPTGWSICLERELEKDFLTTPCEPSAEDKTGNFTFTTNKIDFVGPAFPLYFMNEAPFSYTSEEEPNRHDLPYKFTATAHLKPNKPDTLLVTTNTPNTKININGEIQDVDIDNPLKVDLSPDKEYAVTLFFTTARSDSDALLVTTNTQPFYANNGPHPGTFLIRVYQSVWGILALIILGLSTLSVFQRINIFTPAMRKVLIYSIALLSISALWPKGNEDFFTLILIALSALFVIYLHKWRKLLPFFLIFLLIHTFIFTANIQPYNQLQILGGGDDQLTHEHLSRLIIKSTDFRSLLEGGQPGVYYFQPLHRYFLGFIHKVLGESLWAPAFVQVYLLTLVVSLTLFLVKTIGRDTSVALVSVLIFSALALFENTPLKLALSTYQEAIGLPLFLLALQFTILAWYTKQLKIKAVFFISLLWGLAISTRTNLSPALLAWLAFFIATLFTITDKRRRLYAFISGLLGIIIFPAVIITRNIIIAGKAQFYTSSLHPNLIDPFRPLFPNIGGASDLTFLQVITKLLGTYSGQTNELISILWHNALTNYIGTTSNTQTGWGIAYVLILIGLIIKPLHKKLILLMLLFSSTLPLLFGSLFLHRQIAISSQSNYLLILVLSVSLALILPKSSKKQPHH